MLFAFNDRINPSNILWSRYVQGRNSATWDHMHFYWLMHVPLLFLGRLEDRSRPTVKEPTLTVIVLVCYGVSWRRVVWKKALSVKGVYRASDVSLKINKFIFVYYNVGNRFICIDLTLKWSHRGRKEAKACAIRNEEEWRHSAGPFTATMNKHIIKTHNL